MNTVLIASNEPVLACGFESILAGGGYHVADICGDVVDLFDRFLRCRPDIAILDTGLLPAPGVIADLRKLMPQCQLLIWPRGISQEEGRELLRAGARGILAVDVTPDVLLAALQMVGQAPAPGPVPAISMKESCSIREKQIVDLVGCGLQNDEIAAVLRSDVRTVDKDLKSLTERFGVQDRYELALHCLSMAHSSVSSEF